MLPLLLAVLLPSSSFENVLIDTSVSPRTVAMKGLSSWFGGIGLDAWF